MNFNTIARLCRVLADAGIPIDGVSGTQGNVRVDYKAEATPAHVSEADVIVAAFDWSDAAQAAWEKTTKEAEEPDIAYLRGQATQAVTDINTFLAIASPTNAQVLAEVKAIDQRQRAIIKALARLAIKVL